MLSVGITLMLGLGGRFWPRFHRPERWMPLTIVVAVAGLLFQPAHVLEQAAQPVANAPHVEVDPVALARATTEPHWVPLIHRGSGRPYRLLDPHLTVAIDPATIARVGRPPLVAGLTAFNDVPGSAVHVTVVSELDNADVEVREVPCPQLHDKQGQARPHVDHIDTRGAWVDRARIDVCSRLGERSGHYVQYLMAHELAHLLGFGHLCDEPHCWPLGRRPDPCEFMHPSVHPCQDLGNVRTALSALYPGTHCDAPLPSTRREPVQHRMWASLRLTNAPHRRPSAPEVVVGSITIATSFHWGSLPRKLVIVATLLALLTMVGEDGSS